MKKKTNEIYDSDSLWESYKLHEEKKERKIKLKKMRKAALELAMMFNFIIFAYLAVGAALIDSVKVLKLIAVFSSLICACVFFSAKITEEKETGE